MKSRILILLSVFTPLLAATARNCGCACCKGKEVCCCVTETAAAKPAEQIKRHPLRGVITAVHADRSSLMVKHEEIPGVMRAMTMLFKVVPATLKSVQKGETITAMMSRHGDEWWLHDVKTIVAPARGATLQRGSGLVVIRSSFVSTAKANLLKGGAS